MNLNIKPWTCKLIYHVAVPLSRKIGGRHDFGLPWTSGAKISILGDSKRV